ncbi:uncharacterized protein LOC118277684 [Spodoptera frugiperda]|uniref:Uncharacterized protein LOC118277684 n=1 Tax=Spodoptera frugiperda TaxID=7108 RepID=A0A9R0DGD7_SPOFR|nr:uncharacterized protein LOC118277684 [Spodoptera frugiperda]
MTNSVALVVAFSFIINDIHFFIDSSILQNKHFTSSLVYLLSVCLVLRKITLIPGIVSKKWPMICFITEVPISIVILEAFLFYFWKPVQDYLLLHSDTILVHLAEERSLDWLVCHLCCGHSNCSEIFADVILKFLSFVILFSVSFISVKHL